MAKGTEKQRRREIVRVLRKNEDADAEARRPLAKLVLSDLLAYLETELLVRAPDGQVATRCDHTFAKTKTFLQKRELWSDSLTDWFAQYGGFCDCEVMFNVFDYWTPQRLADSA